MRLGWRIPLPGSFYLGGTVWRSHRRTWHGTLPGWKCRHGHRTREAAIECAQREERRRSLI